MSQVTAIPRPTDPRCPVCRAEIEIDWLDVTSITDLLQQRRFYLRGTVACYASYDHDVTPILPLLPDHRTVDSDTLNETQNPGVTE